MKKTNALILIIITLFSCSKDGDYREKYFGNYNVEVTYNYKNIYLDSLITDTVFKARRIATVSKFKGYFYYQCTIYPDTEKMVDILYDENLKSKFLYGAIDLYCVYLYGYIHPHISENGILEYPEFVSVPWSGYYFEGKIDNDSIYIYYGDNGSSDTEVWSYTIKGKRIE